MLQQYDRIIYDIISSYRPVESSVIGNFINYIETKFPKDYFNEQNISTSIPLFHNKENMDSPDSNIKLNTFPQLNIEVTPTLTESEYQTDSSWYQNSYLKSNSNTKIMEDYDGYKFIRAGLDRSVIQLNIQILEDTEFKAIETSKYLTRALPFGRKTFLNDCTIGFIIPNQLIWTIANSLELDINVSDKLEWFKHYLYNSSNGSIRYSLDSASKQHIFTFNYTTSIVMEITDTPSMSIERSNKVQNYTEITFEVKLDLPTIPSLIYFQESTLDKGADLREYIGMDNDWNAFVSVPILALPSPQIKYDTNKFLQLAFYTSIITDNDIGMTDMTDLSSIIPEYILNKWKTVDDSKKTARIWSGADEVSDADFSVDNDTILIIRKPTLRRSWQYRIALYIDSAEFSTAEWTKLKDTTPFA